MTLIRDINTLDLGIPYQINMVGNYGISMENTIPFLLFHYKYYMLHFSFQIFAVWVETNIMGLWKTSFALVCLISLTLLPSSHAQDSPQDYLNAHNAARAQVGVAPLSWDTNLANYAQRYADSRIGDCNLVLSGGPYGENLAKSTGDLSGTAAVNLFVSEKADYNYNSNTCAAGKVCGHYTQVVWRS